MDWEIVMLGEIIQREKDKYDCLYVESKKKWYKWIYLQSRNRDTDIENKLMVTKKGREGDRLGDWGWHTHSAIHTTDNE